DEETHVAITVHNQGPPIPADALPFIFDPFRQVEAGACVDPRSVGLGLYIVKQIVMAHGGPVGGKSPDGDGTTFTVRLPRHPETGRSAGHGSLKPPPGECSPGVAQPAR